MLENHSGKVFSRNYLVAWESHHEYSENYLGARKTYWEKQYEEIIQVLEVIDSHPGTVCAVLSGHDHEGEIVFLGGSAVQPQLFSFLGGKQSNTN